MVDAVITVVMDLAAESVFSLPSSSSSLSYFSFLASGVSGVVAFLALDAKMIIKKMVAKSFFRNHLFYKL